MSPRPEGQPPAKDTAEGASVAPSGTPDDGVKKQENAYPNVMASVLERHEQIANRLRNKK